MVRHPLNIYMTKTMWHTGDSQHQNVSGETETSFRRDKSIEIMPFGLGVFV